MRTVYTILVPGMAPQVHEVDWPVDPGWDRIKSVASPLCGASPEHVTYLTEDGRYSDMFVDEIGQLKGLERNEVATAHYRRNSLKLLGYTGAIEDLPDVVGPAVVFNRKVWF